jgi:hypothetical protein
MRSGHGLLKKSGLILKLLGHNRVSRFNFLDVCRISTKC